MAEKIKAKKILSTFKDDRIFGIKYNMNLYRGCQHGCIYCDSRSSCYGLGDISEIRIKENAVELLAEELCRLKVKGTVGTGSMNDPYMPIEKDTLLTAKALDVIVHYRFPVHIITKSPLVLRDIEKIREIGKVYAAVSVTVTTASEKLSSLIEPEAPSPEKRFESVRKLSENGIYTGILMTPVLPFLTDTDENLRDIIKMAREAGASYLLFYPAVTLRDVQREYFFNRLDKSFPGLKERYEKEFGISYCCHSLRSDHLYREYIKLAEEYRLETKMRFYTNQAESQISLF